MWRKLFKCFGARVVMTIDDDGEVRIRFGNFTERGMIVSKRYGKIILPLDGGGNGYIKEWYEI